MGSLTSTCIASVAAAMGTSISPEHFPANPRLDCSGTRFHTKRAGPPFVSLCASVDQHARHGFAPLRRKLEVQRGLRRRPPLELAEG